LSLPGDSVDGCNKAGKIDVDLGRFNGSSADLICARAVATVAFAAMLFWTALSRSCWLALALSPGGVAVDVKFGPTLHCLGIGKHSLACANCPSAWSSAA